METITDYAGNPITGATFKIDLIVWKLLECDTRFTFKGFL